MCIQKHTCVCPQQQMVGQPLTLGCNPHLTYSANDFFIGLFCKCSQQQLVDQPWTRVRNLLKGSTHISVLTAANGWPTLDPWLQPLIALFCNTHVCVLTAAIGLPIVLNVQSPQMTSSLTSSATHMCVLTAAIGRPTFN